MYCLSGRIRYNERREKQAPPEAAFVFRKPLTNKPPASAGSGAHQRGACEFKESKRKTSDTAGGICFSWTTNGGNGAWTSWPPHEHEKDLEEVYCYFDMDDPHFGLHLSYVEPGDTHGVVAHTVKSGTMILAPRGYHPTVAAPGTRNTYLWVLAAHSHKSRRYDLAVLDPKRAEMN